MLSTGTVGVEIRRPGDEGYDEARLAWNLTAVQRPAAVAFPTSAADVQAVVAAARAEGLRVAAQATGHGACALGPLDDTVLVRTTKLRGVTIDPVARTARAGAGDAWEDVVGPAAEHGLVALAGSAPDVGVVGYTLGGGIGWLARKHGLACNHVTATEVVLADGSIVRCDPTHERDLFWALRGGGGSFGIVTALEFGLVHEPDIVGGALMWPWERASEVLHAWVSWTGLVPDAVTSIGRIMQIPTFPHIPEALRGRAFVVVEAAILGDAAVAGDLLAPLRALGPEIDTFHPMAPAELQHIHNDPPNPVPGLTDTALLDGLPGAAIDAFVGAVGAGAGSALLGAELRHLGGALAIAPHDAGATPAIDAPFAAFGVGIAATPELEAATAASLTRLRSALAPFEGSRSYLNFVDRPVDTRSMFRSAAHMLLRQIKTQVDPDDVIRANHPIAPLGA
jgi:hypothetical protein